MTRLPTRRKPARSNIERAPPRKYPRHERWVRSHSCSVPGCSGSPIEFAHIRSAANSGMGIKPAGVGISLCSDHHREQHSIGQRAFEKLHNMDLLALASEFIRQSPDTAIRSQDMHKSS